MMFCRELPGACTYPDCDCAYPPPHDRRMVEEIKPSYEAVCKECSYPNHVSPTHMTFICRQCGKEQEK